MAAREEPEHRAVIAPSRRGLRNWSCSCGQVSRYDYGSFGAAADAVAGHVPGNEALIIYCFPMGVKR